MGGGANGLRERVKRSGRGLSIGVRGVGGYYWEGAREDSRRKDGLGAVGAGMCRLAGRRRMCSYVHV